MAKYVFVTGGVLSSLGKGITASSIGAILKAQGYSVMIKKFDPYLNYNPGMMSPLQHGEVFVTEDGCEGDLDLGHYERFINADTNKNCDITSGQVYYKVIENERKGVFKGSTVQVIPHITDEIKKHVVSSSSEYDVILIEIGGTVGDIEGQPFLEAIRQMSFELGDSNVAFVHVTPLIYVKTAKELKTKPTQHSVQKLREIGITPDVLICRSEYPVSADIKKKLALFCNIKENSVITALDASPLYQVILNLFEEGVHNVLLDKLCLESRKVDLSKWEMIIHKIKNPVNYVNISIVGKYIDMKDAYISLCEALMHGGLVSDTKVNINWVDAHEVNEDNIASKLSNTNAILIPGGFGARGMNGKIVAASFARLNKIPFLGIGSLGMQCAVIEVARNKGDIKDADSVEASADTRNPIFIFCDDKGNEVVKKGRMRLGSYEAYVLPDSKAFKIYNSDKIFERHRHRLEFNNKYREIIENIGFNIGAINKSNNLVELVEYKEHPWYIACQFIPEYRSRPLSPHPLFISFIKAALDYKNNITN